MTDDLLMIAKKLGECAALRDRYRAALVRIAEINNGPDRASGEYRCVEAAAIAKKALEP